ncbi:putative membrane protein [Sinobacterium caligoides]|uniref:Putative membrane protein n=1 Tax=Sinobacterium caligoides TaxID=933926 RepID=A0A3N2DL91_9GAMM|nr:PACE efflux transporter [Sinobacterium caligoides]ROS00125.1 putative membrane protein [Sinobacterium caligoides]
MSFKERIFHTLMFELCSLLLIVPAAVLFTGKSPWAMTGLALAISLLAMSWNYLYNILFDLYYGHDRLARTLSLRIWHGTLFEGGLLVVTLPLMMWVLQLDFWTVFIMDVGLAAFYLLYAIAYNYAYDHLRARYIRTRES